MNDSPRIKLFVIVCGILLLGGGIFYVRFRQKTNNNYPSASPQFIESFVRNKTTLPSAEEGAPAEESSQKNLLPPEARFAVPENAENFQVKVFKLASGTEAYSARFSAPTALQYAYFASQIKLQDPVWKQVQGLRTAYSALRELESENYTLRLVYILKSDTSTDVELDIRPKK